MAKYKVVMVRHGESEWNQKNQFCGWFDSLLSEKGKQEAIAAGKLLKEENYQFDVAHTSVLTRAEDTLEAILKEIGQSDLPVKKSWRLNERHCGGLTGLNKAETATKYGEEQVRIWLHSFDVPPPPMEEGHPYYDIIVKDERYKDGPSKEEFLMYESLKLTIERTLPYWNDVIIPDLKAGKRVIIAAHGNSLLGIVKHLDNLSESQIMDLNLPTGIPFFYELDEDFKPLISMQFFGDAVNVKTESESVLLKATKEKSADIATLQQEPAQFDNLPYTVLRNIFNYLYVKDLLNAVTVCENWSRVAQDTEVWKHKVWIPSTISYCDIKTELKKAPFIAKINVSCKSRKGFKHDIVLMCAIENLKSIYSLKCSHLSEPVISALSEKHTSLKSLCLTNINDIKILINIFEKMTSLELECIELNYKERYQTSTPEVIKKMVDCLSTSFSSLLCLKLTGFQNILNENQVIQLFNERKHSLKHFAVDFTKNIGSNVLNVISNYPNISVYLTARTMKNLRVVDLNNLKYLQVYLHSRDLYYLQKLTDFKNMHLNKLVIKIYFNTNQDVSAVIKKFTTSFPNMKTIEYKRLSDYELGEEIDLKCLEKLKIMRFNGFSYKSFESPYLSTCISVKQLHLRNTIVGEKFMKKLCTLKQLRVIKLYECRIEVLTLEKLIAGLEELNSLQLHRCTRDRYYYYNEDDVVKSKEMCKTRSIYFVLFDYVIW